MNRYKIFENGVNWLKADFHLHTKADKEFIYNGNNFIEEYINTLKEAEIRIGVITNHNKFDIDEFKELIKKAKENEIYLLPGVEFSVKDGSKGIHILIVFKEDWIDNRENKNYIQDFLVSAFSGIPNYDISPYPNSNYDLNETYQQLNKFKKDYFFILAHCDDDSGLFNEIKGRNLESFVKQEAFTRVLAIQKSGNKDNYEKLCKLTNRTIACVEGTDNAKDGLNGILNNKRECFIKIGDFSFDAVKFALIASNERVKLKEKPEIKNSYIKSIEFIGGLLDKQKINFSPELNSLIGIRGSGKSAIIEILRYALGIPFTETSVDKEYKSSLVEYVLGSGGKVIIELVNNHKEIYRIEKIFKQKEDIYKENILQNGISIDAVIEKPVYFGQKDLSNKDANFESDLLKRLIGNRLNDIKKQIEQKKEEIKEIIFQIQKTKNLDEQKKESKTNIENAKHQLKLFKDYGIEEKLKSQTNYESDIAKLSNYINDIKRFIEVMNNSIKDNGTLFDFIPELSNDNKNFQQLFNNIVNECKEEKDKIERSIKSLGECYQKLKEILSNITKNRDCLKEEFAKIKREINQPNLNPDRFIELNRVIQTEELKLKEIEKLEEQKNKLQNDLNSRLTELNNLWHNEFTFLKKEINKINQNQNKLLIEIEYKGRKDLFFDNLKKYFKGCNIRDNTYQELINEYQDFIEIFRDEEKLKKILTNLNQFNDFEKKLNENLFELLTFRVEDKIEIKYNGKELSKHSLGQRASALILFLLTQQEQNILIIDQPEDDLDNQTIYEEVIREIQKLKGNMQFIFATHNANIPVLGDSEKVIVCHYDENKIYINEGSIDNIEIQQLIIKIMEGGNDAFNRRKEIYNVWKSSLE